MTNFKSQLSEILASIAGKPEVATDAEIKQFYVDAILALIADTLGEDEKPLPTFDDIDAHDWCEHCDQILNADGDCLCVWRNQLRAQLRRAFGLGGEK